MKYLDIIFLWPLWVKYDDVKEPWRFLLAMGIILIPTWILMGVFPVNPFVVKVVLVFYIYLILCSGWKMLKIS